MLLREERLSGASQRPGELRTVFQRDRDRILYSGHLRRLSGITQVTTPSELHSFHNRLTHTLEVAQVARRIAERANIQHASSDEFINPDVCESAALAHDLGHPPFGHNGEKILHAIATGSLPDCQPSNAIRDGYEGNAQSLRILLKLAVRSGSERGLDLTAATLRATIKYPWIYGGNESKPDKFGVFDADFNEFNRIWEGLAPQQQTLEAQVMDWSDDVAYSTHDFYDFALAGLIPIEALKNVDASELEALLASNPGTIKASPDAYEVVAQSFGMLPDPPLLSTSRLSSPVVGMLKEWVSFQIGRFAGENIEFVKSGDDYDFRKLETIEEEVAILKALTYHYAIGSPALAVRQEGEKQILTTLFKVLDDSANSEGKKLLSEDAQESIQKGTHPTRVVLDVLSSMTDAQATSMYHKLTGISPISILDVTTTSAF